MPSQFQGYCYSTQAEAASADISQPPIAVNIGLASALSYTVTNSTTVQVTYSYKPTTTTVSSTFVHTRVYPLCSSVGQINNNSGISVADALTVSWLVVLVWAVAFYFRQSRVGVRGY